MALSDERLAALGAGAVNVTTLKGSRATLGVSAGTPPGFTYNGATGLAGESYELKLGGY